MSFVSTNSDGKNVRYKMDFYTLYSVLLVIMLLLTIAVICYHYTIIRQSKNILAY